MYNKIILILVYVLLINIPTIKSSNAFNIISYNVGLAYTYVPYSQERKQHIIDALKLVDSDILCLQEVWEKQDIELIKNSLQDKWPYSHSIPFAQKYSESSPACSIWKLFGPGSLGICLLKKCLTKEGDQLTNCVLNDCGYAINQLKHKDPNCAQALFAQVGSSFVKGILNVINPFKKAELFAYHGSSGLLMLSKHPLVAVDTLDFFDSSTLNRRAALYGKVMQNEKEQHVFCTHLTSNLSNVPYVGSFQSWIEESTIQAKSVIEFADKKAINGPQFLVGDFNCSFANQAMNISSEAEETCKQFQNNGYKDPVALDHPECSFCSTNTLVDEEKNILIDHIFTKNIPSNTSWSTNFIFKQMVTLKLGENREEQSNLSDHYGVQYSIR